MLLFVLFSHPLPEKDLVGIDPSNGQLCFLSAEADLSEAITIKRSLLKEHPRITVHTNLVDAHFYILKKWVADFVNENRSELKPTSRFYFYFLGRSLPGSNVMIF
jgi:hypothetical protein